MKRKLISLVLSICLIFDDMSIYDRIRSADDQNPSLVIDKIVEENSSENEFKIKLESMDSSLDEDVKSTIEYLFPKNTKYLKMVDPALMEDIGYISSFNVIDVITESILPNQAVLLNSGKNALINYKVSDIRYDNKKRIIDFTSEVSLIDADTFEPYNYTKIVDISVEYVTPNPDILTILKEYDSNGKLVKKVYTLSETLSQIKDMGLQFFVNYQGDSNEESTAVLEFDSLEAKGVTIKRVSRAGDPFWHRETLEFYYDDIFYGQSDFNFYVLNLVSANKDDTPENNHR